MENWKAQLAAIRKLRLTRQQADDHLYAKLLGLRKTEAILKTIQQRQVVQKDNQQDVKNLRESVRQLEAQLQNPDKRLRKAQETLNKLRDNQNYESFLQRKLEAIRLQEEDLRRALEEAKQQRDEQRGEELRKSLREAEQLLGELTQSLAETQREGVALESERQEAASQKEQREQERGRIRERIQGLETELADKLRAQELDADKTTQAGETLKQDVAAARQALNTARDNLQIAVEGLYGRSDPRDLIINLDDGIPFLLLPVRLETRFITVGAGTELWLRIYPDDIAVHTHEKTLTDKEASEGKKYWLALFNAEKADPGQREALKKSAWSHLAALFGSQRAAWVALQTKPLNWKSDLTGINSPDQLDFPPLELTKPGSWSRAPRTNVLPDKFVVMLYEGETVHEVIGRTIPDELFVGPDPLEEEEAYVEKDGKLVFGSAFDWTSDFAKAVEVGMGFRIPLTRTQAASGFDKILVCGIYLSAAEEDCKKIVEELIDNHHYSPNGFSLVRQGTPTNNTDEAGSGYTANERLNELDYFIEAGDPLFEPDDNRDGRRLADALGIDYAPLQYIANSDASDYEEAVAMNTALYPTTLGYYFDTLLHPVLNDEAQDELRDFFINHVTGRGPLPAIRVGDQPYGILLTSDFGKWRWQRREPGLSTAFLTTLYALLSSYHATWVSLLPQLMHVGKPGVDSSQVLMNILGLQPGSASFHQRIGYSTDDLINRDEFQYGGRYAADLRSGFTSKNLLLNFFSQLGYEVTRENGLLVVPQLLRLVFQHFHTTLDAANLVDNVPLSEKELLRNYDEAALKNYIHWLAEANSVSVLEQQDFGTGKSAPTALLYLKLRRALLLQLNKSTVRWFNRQGIDLSASLKTANFYNIRPQGNITKWEVMKAPVGAAAPDHAHKDSTVSEFLLTEGRDENEAAFLNRMRDALGLLAGVHTSRLERCFTEHIDACTYRLDAWQTGMFDLRLNKQRRPGGIDVERKTGVYLGSYGWLEDVRPSNRHRVVADGVPAPLVPRNNAPLFEYDDNGGFVHAPSLNQASAAAVLRGGYLSHARDSQPDVLSVNLSSARIRRALFILSGLRGGQRLEALLGYQFERGLHDRASADSSLIKLNLYIYDFRDAFPIELHQLQQQGNDAPLESIPANNVVNGLVLAEKSSAFPYGATGAVVAATATERAVIEQEKDSLADTLDAVKDLLLSESVYQLVQGNYDRSGAIINALRDANIPPEIDVINTPRGSHVTFTNRVTIHFANLDPDDPAANPWPAASMTPRSRMEPGLNSWLKSVLGDAEQLWCRVSHLDADGNEAGQEEVSVDKLGLQPIDLVYIIGNELNTGASQDGGESRTSVSEIESRIALYYRKQNALDDDAPLKIEFAKPTTKKTLGRMLGLLRALKSLVTDSRHLDAQDFDPASKKIEVDKSNPKGFDEADLLARVQDLQTIFQGLLAGLNNLPILAEVEESDGTITTHTNLKDAFIALANADKNFSDINFSFTNSAADQLQNILIHVADFGLPDTFPQATSTITDSGKLKLLEQAGNVARKMGRVLQETANLMTEAAVAPATENRVQKLTEACQQMTGEVFNILPRFIYNNEAELQQSHADEAQLIKFATNNLKMKFVAEEWLQNVSHVRPKVARWDHVRTLHEALNDDVLLLQPVQLPYRAKDSWIAVEFPETDELDPTQPFNIAHDTLAITIHGAAAFVPAAKQCGLLIDDWTEVIPTKEEVTGIAFNYNQPNATPPQALLLAVTPEEKGNWTWDNLVGILNDTLQRAKLRAVEPLLLETINKPEVNVLLPAVLADFSQYDLNIALDYRLNLTFFAEALPILLASSRK